MKPNLLLPNDGGMTGWHQGVPICRRATPATAFDRDTFGPYSHRMTRILLLALVTLSAWSFSADASAMSCQRRVVSRGDSQARVLQYCGNPATKTERVIQNSSSVLVPLASGGYAMQAQSVSVLQERWVYNFGPRRLMREVTFQDGIIVRIRTLGYGTEQSAPTLEKAGAGSLVVKLD